ncbi:acyl-CoA synthetase [Sphingobium sufflavum]|uniref:acyl-CoA synthetase n=1 Tax=Sphingobium sufflavum TaxID=1129547 RepID=UPI001F2A7B21|nr:acyl-CoA synthetase [Sphingobium sufflavum]MCE7795404.1 acyl-CoA synthetase [Sphingobium sufflavum]
MHPLHHAASHPTKAACIIAETGETLSYDALDRASNRGAHLLRALGLRRGDVVATMLDNESAIFEIAWAAQRSGVYLTSISTRLTAADTAYIVADSGARLLIVSDRLIPLAREALQSLSSAPSPSPVIAYATSAAADGFASWRLGCGEQPDTPIADESPGTDMLYSSGTTGRPKGVKPPLPEGALDASTPLLEMGRALYGMDGDTVYLSTSPLYHAAPLRWAITVQRLGGTVVVMTKFDAEQALRFIEDYRITHSTWVPTHFIRLLKLPDAIRARYDHRSLKAVIHAAAPCPVPVKQAMIQWWGPIIHEYYSGTETCGITALSSEEWLRKPGSVGRAVLGVARIVGEDGRELPVGQTGDVYFADGPKFEYHKDPAKTAKAHNDRGWATLGDIGHLDEDGYLFLTDRRNFMIISGGVNIYPQEIENLLVTHPKVADVAVVGEPDDEMGERVVAVVQPAPDASPNAALAQELSDFARAALGGVKTPRRFDFRSELPREATGKLLKARLIAEYRGQRPA